MPPKKEEKGKKGQGNALKEVDPNLYIRKPEVLPEIFDPTEITSLVGKVANIENIFPEWSIDSEVWSEPVPLDAIPEIVYPSHLLITNSSKLTAYLGLESKDTSANDANNKGKKTPAKKDAKKGKDAGPVTSEMVELFEDENGNKLPYILNEAHFDKEKDASMYHYTGRFYRFYSALQEQVGEKQKHLRLNILNSSDPNEIKKLKRELEKSLADHKDMEHQLPSGREIDPYICSAYRAIMRFAPPILHSHTTHSGNADRMEYLWNSIYPKLPSGKPVYNPSGKYCVRLFLGGKWRKVYVDDTIPLRPDNLPAVSSSVDKLELWPMILSKAIYTVYSACGFSTLIADVEDAHDRTGMDVSLHAQSHRGSTDEDLENTASAPAMKISQFVGFVVHLLTSWLPSVPTPLSTMFSLSVTTGLEVFNSVAVEHLLISIVNGGACNIEHHDVIDNATESAMLNVHRYIHDLEVDAAKKESDTNNATPTLKTKRQFKEECIQQKEERDEVIVTISSRESKIHMIEAAVQRPIHELYLAVIPMVLSSNSHQNGLKGLQNSEYKLPTRRPSLHKSSDVMYRVATILGISRPLTKVEKTDGSGGVIMRDNVKEVKILLEWKKKSVLTPITPITKLTSASLPPLPNITEIEFEWISIGDLIRGHTMFFTLDTRIKTPFTASLSRHWIPFTPRSSDTNTGGSDAKGGNRAKTPGKGKDKAKDTETAPSTAMDGVCKDPGLIPVTLLSIDSESFFQMKDESEVKTTPHDPTPTVAHTPTVHAAHAEHLSAGPPPKSPIKKLKLFANSVAKSVAKVFSLNLTIYIHADCNLSNPIQDSSIPQPPMMSPMLGYDNDASLKKLALPGPVMIVLQELNLNDDADAEPLIIKFDLDKESYMPLAKKSFQIPFTKFPKNRKDPLLFWVRLYTKCSVMVSFATEVKIQLGHAADIWNMTGRATFIQEGNTATTRPSTEQLLFRIPLQLQYEELMSSSTEEVVATSSPKEAILSTKPSMVFLHIADREIEKNVSLVVLTDPEEIKTAKLRLANGSSEEGAAVPSHDVIEAGSFTLPRVQGNRINISQHYAKTLIGTIFPSDSYGPSVIPSFQWKLLVLSPQLLLPLTRTLIEQPVVNRYNGRYIPNNKLLLFKDVMTIDKVSFPIALRLKVELPQNEMELSMDNYIHKSVKITHDHVIDAPEKIHFIWKFYRKSDNYLVTELKGSGLIQSYYLHIDKFLNPDESLPVYPNDTGAKVSAAKTPAPAKGKNVPVAVDTVDIITECYLDETAMKFFPKDWKSRYPHNFDVLWEQPSATQHDATPHLLLVKPPRIPPFQWQLDVLAGKVTNISHDIRDLERYTAMKNSWESSSAGRMDRAAAALTYYQEKKQQEHVMKKLLIMNHEMSEEVKDEKKDLQGDVDRLENNMIDLLTQALNGNAVDIKERYLHIFHLPEYQEFIEVLEMETPTVLTADDIESRKSMKDSEQAQGEARFKDMSERFMALNEKLKENTKKRIDSLIEIANQNTVQLSNLWVERENYRLNVQEKNNNLKYLLMRANEAKQSQYALENTVVPDVGAKGKKAPPPKKK